jgi:hypothetical protein
MTFTHDRVYCINICFYYLRYSLHTLATVELCSPVNYPPLTGQIAIKGTASLSDVGVTTTVATMSVLRTWSLLSGSEIHHHGDRRSEIHHHGACG